MWGVWIGSAAPKADEPDLRQVRIEQFMAEALKDWQALHSFNAWAALEDREIRTIYAKALVRFVETLRDVGEW